MRAEIRSKKMQMSELARTGLIRGTILLFVISIQLWLAVFGYLSFYYLYMPVEKHEQPVFFEFSACRRYSGGEDCPFPFSNITFAQDPGENRVLMRGQEYEMLLELEMPESPVNERQGTFMAKVSLFAEDGTITTSSARPVTLKYRSWLFKIFDILLSTPFMLLGYSEESQAIVVHMLEEYVDHPYKPAVGAVLELQALKLEVYRANFIIHAQFSGLRYLMYYWPITTGLFAITGNFSILSIISMLSYVPLSAYLFRNEDEDDGSNPQDDDGRHEGQYEHPRPNAGRDIGRQRVDRRLVERERQALFERTTASHNQSLNGASSQQRVPRRSPARSELESHPRPSEVNWGDNLYPQRTERGSADGTPFQGDSGGSSDSFEQLDYDTGVVDILGSGNTEENEDRELSTLRQRVLPNLDG